MELEQVGLILLASGAESITNLPQGAGNSLGSLKMCDRADEGR
jgi:hypothetical protein